MAKHYITPVLEWQHPWLNNPDTKFNKDGLFHVDGKGKGDAVEELANKIAAAAQAAFDEHVQEMPKGEAKKWSVHNPFERLEDEDGNPTGEIVFTFKQNAKIPSKKEESGFKNVRIEMRDSKDELIEVQVWDGSAGRIRFSMRPIVQTSSKKAGVRLDFDSVQITKLVSGGGSKRPGFGAVEGGFEASGEDKPQDNRPDDKEDDY